MYLSLLFVLCALCLSSLPFTEGSMVTYSWEYPAKITFTGDRKIKGEIREATIYKATNSEDPTYSVGNVHKHLMTLSAGSPIYLEEGQCMSLLSVGDLIGDKFVFTYKNPEAPEKKAQGPGSSSSSK